MFQIGGEIIIKKSRYLEFSSKGYLIFIKIQSTTRTIEICMILNTVLFFLVFQNLNVISSTFLVLSIFFFL